MKNSDILKLGSLLFILLILILVFLKLNQNKEESVDLTKTIFDSKSFEKVNDIRLYSNSMDDLLVFSINYDDSSKNWILKKGNLSLESDPQKIRDLFNRLKNLTYSQKVSQADFDKKQFHLKDFGIDLDKNPWYFLGLNDSKEKEIKIYKGSETPDKQFSYIKTSVSDDLYLIPNYQLSILDIELFDLRETNFLKDYQYSLSKILFQNKQESFSFIPSEEKYIKVTSFPKISLPDTFKDFIRFDKENKLIFFKKNLSKENKNKLMDLSKDPEYQKNIEEVYKKSYSDSWKISSLDLQKNDLSKIEKWIDKLFKLRVLNFVDSPNTYQKNINDYLFSIHLESENKKMGKLNLGFFELDSKLFVKNIQRNLIYEINKKFLELNKDLSFFKKDA